MGGTLYTNGQLIEKTVAEFEFYDVIRFSAQNPNYSVGLRILDAGTLDLADELGSTEAYIHASSFGNTLIVGSGNIDFYGAAGNDILLAGLGNDSYYFSAGTDYVDLGGNTPVPGGGWGGISFMNTTSGVTFDFNLDHVSGTTADGIGTTYYKNITDVWGGDYNDTFIGNADDNYMMGFGGNDTFIGGSGNESMFGGTGTNTASGGSGNDRFVVEGGTDTFDGGAGNHDQLDFKRANAVTVNLSSGSAQYVTYNGSIAGVVTFTNVEDVNGSNFNDTITGDAGNNWLWGNGGNDVVSGGDGNDTLWGGTGNDTLLGGAGNDRVVVNAGTDTFDGGTGTHNEISFYAATADVVFNLASGVANYVVAEGAGTTSFTNVQDVIGSSYNDTLTGDARDNWFFGGGGTGGGGGTNFINGGLGNDVMFATERSFDYFDGGDGIDGVSFYFAYQGVYADMKLGWVDVNFSPITYGTVYFSNIEGLGGSRFNDSLIGDNFGNELRGYDGDDFLSGGLGNDILEGGKGADGMNGGDGKDTASYALAETAVVASLLFAATNTGEAAGDTYKFIENLTGSAFSDTLSGNNSSNTILGGLGNDSLTGFLGNDRLDGGEGNDLLNGGIGADKLVGGLGVDTATYATATAGVGVHLLAPLTNTGEAAGDTYSSIENLTGSAFDDWLEANNSNNVLRGGAGSDSIYGFGGNDTIYGDSSDGPLIGALGNDVTYDDEIHGGIGNDKIYGEQGDDFLAGDAGNDTLYGGDGNDTLSGGAGNDILYGGAGRDHFYFRELTGIDTVKDFDVTIDQFSFDPVAFGIDPAANVADYVRLANSSTILPTAPNADHGYFLANKTGIYWDDDGSGAHAAVKLAAYSSLAGLTLGNFEFLA